MTPSPKTSRKARYLLETMLPQPEAGAILDRHHSWSWNRDSEKESPGVFAFRTNTYPKDGKWLMALGFVGTLTRILFPSPSPMQDRTFALAQHRQQEAMKFRYSATLTTQFGSERGSAVVLELEAEPNGDESQWESAGTDPRNHVPIRNFVAAIAKALGAVVSVLPERST